jgi:hypothetical protein
LIAKSFSLSQGQFELIADQEVIGVFEVADSSNGFLNDLILDGILILGLNSSHIVGGIDQETAE